jgi:hypothetical protein
LSGAEQVIKVECRSKKTADSLLSDSGNLNVSKELLDVLLVKGRSSSYQAIEEIPSFLKFLNHK